MRAFFRAKRSPAPATETKASDAVAPAMVLNCCARAIYIFILWFFAQSKAVWSTAISESLAEALPRFSLDLVKVVVNFLIFPTASKDAAKPVLLQLMGASGKDDGQFDYPIFGLGVSPSNTLWVAVEKRVQVFSADGVFLHHVAKGSWEDACGLAFAANGDVYIADHQTHSITVCRSDGTFLRRFGKEGSGNEEFNGPIALAVDSKQGLVFVSDDNNNRVHVVTLEGKFVRNIAWENAVGDESVHWPRGIALTEDGQVVVADSAHHRVQVCCSLSCLRCCACSFLTHLLRCADFRLQRQVNSSFRQANQHRNNLSWSTQSEQHQR